jgi:hypothetical protein
MRRVDSIPCIRAMWTSVYTMSGPEAPAHEDGRHSALSDDDSETLLLLHTVYGVPHQRMIIDHHNTGHKSIESEGDPHKPHSIRFLLVTAAHEANYSGAVAELDIGKDAGS